MVMVTARQEKTARKLEETGEKGYWKGLYILWMEPTKPYMRVDMKLGLEIQSVSDQGIDNYSWKSIAIATAGHAANNCAAKER